MTLAAAIQTRDANLLPGRRNEDWRWTGLRELIRVLPEASPPGVFVPGGPWAAVPSDERVVVNGRYHSGADIAVQEGETATVRLRFLSAANAGSHTARVAVHVGRDAALTLLESYEGEGEGYVAFAELDIRLDEGARLTRLILGEDTEGGVGVSQATVTLSAAARLHQTVLTSGARRQRLETRVLHPGKGAEVRLDAAYILSGKRHADLTTVVDHAGPGGETVQLTKGVAADQARGVFQGRIVVDRGADGTDARMAHHALLLSDRAEIDAKPELEIYADDVACAHGNTVGALSDEALFYARARGIPEAEARVMLTGAFLGEVVERIAHDGAREAAAAWLAARLEALA